MRGAFAQMKSGQREVFISHDASAGGPAEIFVLGGEAAPRPLIFGGPFVFESQANIQRANSRYTGGEMGTLDGVPF